MKVDDLFIIYQVISLLDRSVPSSSITGRMNLTSRVTYKGRQLREWVHNIIYIYIYNINFIILL